MAILKKFEDMMSAVTFAEAGEHETAREMMKGRKTILLALSDGMFDRKVFKYALNLSERVGASLEVLYVEGADGARKRFREFLEEVEKEGFRFSLVIKGGCVKDAILRYTKNRGEIIFVIIGSERELAVECEGSRKIFSETWKGLKCPLVVVSKATSPSAA